MQPKGPCVLLSWSSGSAIAYATSLFLEESGRVVGFLGLIDGMSPHIYQTVGNETFLDEITLLIDKLGLKSENLSSLNKRDIINRIFNLAGEKFLPDPPPIAITTAQYLMLALLQLQIEGKVTQSVPHIFSTHETLKQLSRLSPGQTGAERDLGWLRQMQPVTIYPPIGEGHTDIIKQDARALVSAISVFFNSPGLIRRYCPSYPTSRLLKNTYPWRFKHC